MALMECPECGKEVSDMADACPHCGYPIANIKKTENRIDGWQDAECEKKNRDIEESKTIYQSTYKEKIAMPIPMIIVACMSFVLAALFMNQSIAVLRLFAIAGMEDAGGLIGITMALLWILSGMLAICFRNMASEMGALISFVICLLTCFIGVLFKTDYKDLKLWTILIFASSFTYFVIAACIKSKLNRKTINE